MAEELETWIPDFKPGWPDIVPTGLLLPQLLVHPGDEDDGDETVLEWSIGPARAESGMAFVGDLNVRNREGFGGAIVVMPLALRDCPDEITIEYANEIVQQYGDWACSIMYDYAAAHLRSTLAASALGVDVPFTTPVATIRPLVSDDEADAAADA